MLLERWRRRRQRTGPPPGHDDAVRLLHDAARDKALADRYTANPNEGYTTPDRSLPPPGGIGAP
jgi:hypothetical protein